MEDHNWKKSIVAKELIKSKWIKKWKIIDENSLTNTISTILSNLSKKVDTEIDEVLIWISHPYLKIKKASNHKRLTNLEITEKEVNNLLNTISEEAEELNYEILKVIPNKWIIDETHITNNPIWMEWRKLELQATIFMIPSSTFKALDKVFEQLEIDIIDILPNILWAEEWVLDAETKDLWCVLIDIGANQTSYVIYEEGINLKYGVIPIWGEEITKDISIGLKVDFIQAEQIKKEEWEIILNKEQTNIENSKIDKLFLSEIIEARLAEDIYSPIIQEMENLWVNGKLPWGIILIWWESKIKNITEFTRQFFGLACKHGKIIKNDFKELGSNPQFVNVIWNYLWFEKYWDNGWGFNFSFNLWWINNIINFIKKIF